MLRSTEKNFWFRTYMSVVALSRELSPADKGSEVRLQGNISQRKKKKLWKIYYTRSERRKAPGTLYQASPFCRFWFFACRPCDTLKKARPAQTFLALDLSFNGDWLTTFNLYSANDLKELPFVGCHFFGGAAALATLLNWVTDSFLKVAAAEVENALIIGV